MKNNQLKNQPHPSGTNQSALRLYTKFSLEMVSSQRVTKQHMALVRALNKSYSYVGEKTFNKVANRYFDLNQDRFSIPQIKIKRCLKALRTEFVKQKKN
jgi:hypothetical protein